MQKHEQNNAVAMEPIVSVRAVVSDGVGRYALVRRAEGQNLAGMWEFPGGGIDEINGSPLSETEFVAAVQVAASRETAQESGLRLVWTGMPEHVGDRTIPDGPHAGRQQRTFGVLALCGNPSELRGNDESEVSDVGWFTRSEIQQNPNLTPASRNAARLLLPGLATM